MRNYEVIAQIKNGQYPDELTFDQFDGINWSYEKQYGLHEEADIEQIKEDAEENEAQIYTQVDGDADRMYSKGLRFVNRTGIYWLVKLLLKVDNS